MHPRGHQGCTPLAPPREKTLADPFTLEHFRAWASELVLDTGESWRLEGFQERFLEDLFSGFPEAWLVVGESNGKTTLIAGVALYHSSSRLPRGFRWPPRRGSRRRCSTGRLRGS